VWALWRSGGLVDVREVYGGRWLSHTAWVSWCEGESGVGEM
jgi:hypothetical protein